MAKSDKTPLPRAVAPSKRSDTDLLQRRKRSGIYLESTEAEQLGVLPHECIQVKDAMSRSVTIVTPLTEIEEAVRLMKSLGVGAVIVCHDSMLVGTLSDRDIALANAPPSEPIHKVMTHESIYCYEDDLLLDVHAMMRARDLTALPVRDINGLFSGIVMRTI
jgi:predicted transcriptional regulator